MIEKEKFRRYDPERDEKPKRDQFTIELNQEQRQWLDLAKIVWDVRSDSVVAKILMEAGKNAIISQLSPKTWKYLLKKDRQRLSEYENLEKLFDQNAKDFW